MNNPVRISKASERHALREIWRQVFKSDDGDLFFEHFSHPKRCMVIEDNGTPVSMGFLLPAGNFVSDGKCYPCGMIYALATLPQYRGHGFATAIVDSLLEAGRKQGYNATILSPSNDDLFDYYNNRTKFSEHFYICERKYSTLGECNKGTIISEPSAREYHAIRESLLTDMAHMKMDIDIIEYQRKLSHLTGGKLVKIDQSGIISCAAIEVYADGAILVKELLAPAGHYDAALSAIGETFPAHQYTVRTPAQINNCSNAHVRRFGMIAAYPAINATASHIAPWYGFALD
ncbi:MAG: GNAT family N-acetyltransferase [Oscillospiraceae bacterium]|nr:GNAT family N-acetyltransferase [Oscillospiraceae bacterium]